MTEKKIGKISRCVFGVGGYQDAMMGLHFTFEGKGWGVGHTNSTWDPNHVEVTEHTKWTEEDRSQHFDEQVRLLSDLLKDAKKSFVHELQGTPVEVTFEGNNLKSFRILTEVL